MHGLDRARDVPNPPGSEARAHRRSYGISRVGVRARDSCALDQRQAMHARGLPHERFEAIADARVPSELAALFAIGTLTGSSWTRRMPFDDSRSRTTDSQSGRGVEAGTVFARLLVRMTVQGL